MSTSQKDHTEDGEEAQSVAQSSLELLRGIMQNQSTVSETSFSIAQTDSLVNDFWQQMQANTALHSAQPVNEILGTEDHEEHIQQNSVSESPVDRDSTGRPTGPKRRRLNKSYIHKQEQDEFIRKQLNIPTSAHTPELAVLSELSTNIAAQLEQQIFRNYQDASKTSGILLGMFDASPLIHQKETVKRLHFEIIEEQNFWKKVIEQAATCRERTKIMKEDRDSFLPLLDYYQRNYPGQIDTIVPLISLLFNKKKENIVSTFNKFMKTPNPDSGALENDIVMSIGEQLSGRGMIVDEASSESLDVQLATSTAPSNAIFSSTNSENPAPTIPVLPRAETVDKNILQTCAEANLRIVRLLDRMQQSGKDKL